MLLSLTTKIAKRALDSGEVHRKGRRWEAAKQQYQRAVRWSARPAARGLADAQGVKGYAHLGLGRVHLKLGHAADAVNDFELACSMLPNAWEPLYWRGCAHGWLRNYSKAAESFTAALTLVPTEASVYLQRGHARFKGGRLDQAVADYLEAQSRGGLRGIDCLALAALHLHRGQYPDAEQLLRTLVKQDHLDAYLLLGHTLEKQGKWTDAAAVYEKAARMESIAPEACERLGIVYTNSQRYEQACTSLEQAMRRRRDSDAVLFYYGWACYQLRRFEQCINIWTLLKRRYPRRQRLSALVQKAKYAWGCDLVQVANYGSAIPLWSDYYSGRESDAQLTRALAELHLRAAAQAFKEKRPEELDEVREYLEEAYDLAPDDTRILFYLALLDMLDGDFEQASLLLQEAVVLDPEDSRLRNYLALCAWENGDVDHAEEELKTVIAQDSSNRWSRRAAELLVALYIEQERWSEAADTLLSQANR